MTQSKSVNTSEEMLRLAKLLDALLEIDLNSKEDKESHED